MDFRQVTISEARRLEGPFWYTRRCGGRVCVESFKKWGPNLMLTTDEGRELVVDRSIRMEVERKRKRR